MRISLFLVITQRVVIVSYRRSGTTYLAHLQGSRIEEKEEEGKTWILEH
jgi:hypothetical protein